MSSIVVGHACSLANSSPASPNTDMANFISFDVYDIDLSKVMNDFQSEFCFVTNDEQVYHRCGRPQSVSEGKINSCELVC